MKGLELVLPSLLVVIAVVVAATPLGLPVEARNVLQVMPCMMAHLCLVRGKGFVPPPVMFAAGLAMDIAGDGPLGFWAFIYLFGVLVTRQLPESLMQTVLGRLSGMLLVVFALAAAEVAIASFYQFRWIDWHAVAAGTLAAGIVTLLIDLAWRERRPARAINVTERGTGGPTHV